MKKTISMFCIMAFILFLPFGAAKAEFVPDTAEVEENNLRAGVGAQAYIVIDAATGQVLVEKNSQQVLFPASITKVLTLALALEESGGFAAAKNEEILMTYEAAHSLLPGSSSVALTEDEVLTFADLVYATHIRSANEASYMLAQYVGGGSKDVFVEMMNAKALELGLTSSNFVNPSGLPDDEHYTTAADMAEITRWALTVDGFRDIFDATNYVMQPTNKQSQERVFNTSNLVLIPSSNLYYEGVTGSKTGFTSAAGHTLVTSAQKNGTELICVIMKSDTQTGAAKDCRLLLDYCFENYSTQTLSPENLESFSVPVFGGGAESLGDITVCAANEGTLPSFLLHNSLSVQDLSLEYQIPEKYVIGQSFEPCVNVWLEKGTEPYLMGVLPLVWYGLDDVFAASQGTVLAAEPLPTWAKALLYSGTFLVLLLVLLTARVLYVKRRRKKRRMARLMAVRAHRPVSNGPRPQPANKNLPPVTVNSNIYRAHSVQSPAGVARR